MSCPVLQSLHLLVRARQGDPAGEVELRVTSQVSKTVQMPTPLLPSVTPEVFVRLLFRSYERSTEPAVPTCVTV